MAYPVALALEASNARTAIIPTRGGMLRSNEGEWDMVNVPPRKHCTKCGDGLQVTSEVADFHH